MLAAVAVVVMLTADASGAVVVLNRRQSAAASPRPPRPRPRPRANPSSSTTTPLAPGQALVSGTVTSLSAGSATGPALATPMLITVPVRGRGSAYIYNAIVGNQSGETIYWYAGQPLSILGNGGLVPGRINVTVNGTGSTWYLDGAERRWGPGNYQVYTPVAVGRSGLANAEPSVDFSAGPDTVLVTTGGATLQRPPMALHLIGPGAVQAQGNLTVRTRKGTFTVRAITLAGGQYVLDLTPGPGGQLSLEATLQGALQTVPPTQP